MLALNNNIIKTLKVLNNIIGYENFYITGSLSLKEYDYIQRSVNDLDIVIEDEKFLINLFKDKTIDLKEESFSDTDIENSLELKNVVDLKTHYRCIINNFKVCIFILKDIPKDDIELTEIDYNFYKILNPKYSIDKKIEYFEKLKIMFDDKNINEHQLNSLIKHADDCIKILKKIK